MKEETYPVSLKTYIEECSGECHRPCRPIDRPRMKIDGKEVFVKQKIIYASITDHPTKE